MELCDTEFLLSSKNAAANFQAFRQNCKFCDVSLQSGHAVVKAHRVVLAAASPYFEAMFNTCNTRLVNVPSISPELLPSLVDFIYTGHIKIKHSTAQELIAAARMLCLEDVVVGCVRVIKTQLNACNVLSILSHAEFLDCSELTECTLAYIGAHWSAVSQSKQFLELSLALLTKILSSDKFVVDNEFEVVCGVVRWLEHAPHARVQHCAELVRHLRLGRVPKHTLDEVWSNVIDTRLAEELRLASEQTATAADARARGKSFFYVVGNARDYEGLSSPVFRYDIYKKVWEDVVPMETQRRYPGVAGLGGRLYVVGGEDDDDVPLASGEVYDPDSSKWSPIAAMNKERYCFNLVALNGKLYALGGDGRERLRPDTFEVYDPAADEWTSIGNKPHWKFSTAVSYNDAIYVTKEMSLLRYEPTACAEEQWRNCANGQCSFFSARSAAVLNGHLYFVSRPHEANKNVTQRYDFLTDRWESVAPKPLNGSCFALGAGGGALLAAGDGTLELYDPAEDRWTRGPDLPLRCEHLGSAVL